MREVLLVACIFTSLIVVLTGVTLIELAKEETARACFEAAKVNPSITCEMKR
jgi:hypothetical protein